jgi:hypothetical protein
MHNNKLEFLTSQPSSRHRSIIFLKKKRGSSGNNIKVTAHGNHNSWPSLRSIRCLQTHFVALWFNFYSLVISHYCWIWQNSIKLFYLSSKYFRSRAKKSKIILWLNNNNPHKLHFLFWRFWVWKIYCV